MEESASYQAEQPVGLAEETGQEEESYEEQTQTTEVSSDQH